MKTIVMLLILLISTPAFSTNYAVIHPQHIVVSAALTFGIYYVLRHAIGIPNKTWCLGFTATAVFMGGAYFEALQGDTTPHMYYDMLANTIGIAAAAIPLAIFD